MKTMKNPGVSVIIPVYNGEATLEKCLGSLLGQGCMGYEVIVVDNDSTDRTKEIIEGFRKKSSKIRYVFEPKGGRGAARNAGIRAAKGKIIAMIDSDCIAPANWIGKITGPIRKENESVVMGFEEDPIKNYWTRQVQKANHDFFSRNTSGGYISHLDTKNFAIKADLMKSLLFSSSLKNSEDFDLYLRLKNRAKIRFLPNVRVKHNHKSSFQEVVKVNIDRGYWTYKIRKKYKSILHKQEPMFESISAMNFAKLPFWAVLQFITQPNRAFFNVVSEASWRVGIVKGMLNGNK